MNNNINYESIIDNLSQIIKKHFNTTQRFDWRIENQLKFLLIYEIISTLLHTKLPDFFTKYNTSKILDKKDIETIRILSTYNIDYSILYQNLLSLDLYFNKDTYEIIKDKHFRNNLGAYYTPDWLSYALTEQTLNEYLLLNHKIDMFNSDYQEDSLSVIKNLKVSDLSSGSGSFIIAYLKVIKKNFQISSAFLEEILHNLYGIDVDPIALLLLKYNIYNNFNIDPRNINTILGNPLLKPNTKLEDKFYFFAEGRIYNSSLGFDEKLHPEQGYDIILGNPPWEKIRFEERTFLRTSYPEISEISQKNKRQIEIKNIPLADFNYYLEYKNDYTVLKSKHNINPLLKHSLKGELNTYNLFYELGTKLLSKTGMIGALVKASMVKTSANKHIFGALLDSNMLHDVVMFNNSKKIFSIDSREEFCFVISSANNNSPSFNLFVNITDESDLLQKEKFCIRLSRNDLYAINPETFMIPNITTVDELELLLKLYRKNNVFSKEFKDIKFGRLVHLTNHSNFISTIPDNGIPIYEGKFIELYDSMFSTFKGVSVYDRQKPKAQAIIQHSPKQVPESRFFIDENFWKNLSKNFSDDYIIAWRSLTSTTNRRTMLASIIPFMPTSQSIQFLQSNSPKEMIIILSLFNSIVFDYLVRLKMPGIDLTQTVIKSIPVPKLEGFDKKVKFKNISATYYEHIYSRIKFLYKDDNRFISLFKTNYYEYNCINRKKCISEIDILIAQLYKFNSNETKKIASCFDAYYSPEEIELYF